MTFEEQFPELKDKRHVVWFKEIPVIKEKDVQAHCLSKQKVREAIKKYAFCPNIMLEELGLEEEK